MARGGGSRRTYVRDANGRFASTPGGSARKAAQSQGGKKGTLASRSSLKRSQSKLAAKDKADQSLQGTLSRRAQKGAVTRGNKALKAAKAESRTRLKVRKPEGVIGKKKGVSYEKAKPVAMKAKAGVAGKPLGGDRKILAASATARAGRMKPPITLKRMQQIGGNRWQKKGMDRVYFNDLPQRAGMDVSKYKSGNISSASLRGRGISNSKAKEIYGNLADSKVYYDRTKRRMVSQGPYIPSGRSSQRTKAAVLLGSVAKKLERQSRIRPTLRANQKRRKAA